MKLQQKVEHLSHWDVELTVKEASPVAREVDLPAKVEFLSVEASKLGLGFFATLHCNFVLILT